MSGILAYVSGGLRDYYRLVTGRSLRDDEDVVRFAFALGTAMIMRLVYGSIDDYVLENVVNEIPVFKIFYEELGIDASSFRDASRLVAGIVSRREAFEKLYYVVRDKAVRKRLGAFFTEPSTASMMASTLVEKSGGALREVLDPAVGGGTLLAAVLEKLSRSSGLPELQLRGVDVDPAALLLAYANIAYTAWRIDNGVDVLSWTRSHVQLSWNDYIARYRVAGRLLPITSIDYLDSLHDAVIANPPWVHVNIYGRARSRAYLSRIPRRLLYTLADIYKDTKYQVKWPEMSRSQPPIALVFLYYMLRQFRRIATVLVTGTLLKSWNTAGFRQWLVENYSVSVTEIYCRDLEETSSWPIILEATHNPTTSIEYRVITCRNSAKTTIDTVLPRELVSPLTYPSPAGPWATPLASTSLLTDIAEATRGLSRIGELYKIYRGVNTNAASVYIFKTIRRIDEGLVEATSINGETVILEPDLLHVFVRGARLNEFTKGVYEYILLPHNPETMKPLPENELQANYPHTYKWLTKHKKLLEKRSRSPKPWYRVMDVSANKVKGAKIAWRKHSILLDFTPLPEYIETPLGKKLVIIDGTLYYLSTENNKPPSLQALNHKVVKILAWMTAKPKGGHPYREYYSWHIALLPYDKDTQTLDKIYEKHKNEINKIIKNLTT